MVDKLIQEAQERAGVARYEQVRKFAFLPKAFTIESGELTPTLKIKRNVVTSNFINIIESIYNKESEKLNERDSTV
jgi:long-chain acyl-CoA synthetase